MNILFVLYHDFQANSAIHVHSFANELVRFGHCVGVAVPKNKETSSNLGEGFYSTATFSEIDGRWSRIFENGRPPDLVHAWTPRETVRAFCHNLRRKCPFELFIHLEDNEETILEAHLHIPFAQAEKTTDLEIPPSLSHPKAYRGFLAEASGVTIIMDRLAEFVPRETPRLLLWPGAERKLFYPRPKDETLLKRLAIPLNSTIICYTGNVHAVNAREVRSLYLAVAMLNREGIPATLVRAGRDYYPFLGQEDDQWARKYSVELGYVPHIGIPSILSLADFLIQPGARNQFNEYRLPSKLPEFFAMGKPVILPRTNLGRFVEHGVHAWVLENVDALGILGALRHLRGDPALVRHLSEGAIEFYKVHFDWAISADKLNQFYNAVLQKSSSPERETHSKEYSRASGGDSNDNQRADESIPGAVLLDHPHGR